MRRIRVLVLLGFALVGCGLDKDKVAPVPDYPSVIDGAEFPKALTQAPTGRSLGLSPTLQGQVAQWPATTMLPVSLEWPQINIIGEIEKTGEFKVKLPEKPPVEFRQGVASIISLRQLIRGINPFRDSDCSVDTLAFDPSTAKASYLALTTKNPYFTKAAALKSQTSPAPDYGGFSPFNHYFNANEMVLYSDVDATAKGELSCSDKYAGSRYHLYINMTFTKGWNAATLLYAKERTVSGERVQEMLLQGGVLSTTAVY